MSFNKLLCFPNDVHDKQIALILKLFSVQFQESCLPKIYDSYLTARNLLLKNALFVVPQKFVYCKKSYVFNISSEININFAEQRGIYFCYSYFQVLVKRNYLSNLIDSTRFLLMGLIISSDVLEA